VVRESGWGLDFVRDFAPVLVENYRANPRQARPHRSFHRQMAVFREQMREIPTKYKMLWFVLDTYHGQRYFFICGCNRIVMKSG
jgi:hypothetical protein